MAKATTYEVSVKNENYCGIGAGGAHFANGKAIINSERLANWFREHEGYTVKAINEKADK